MIAHTFPRLFLLFFLTVFSVQLHGQQLNWSHWQSVVMLQTGQATKLQWRCAYVDSPNPERRGAGTDYVRQMLVEIRSIDLSNAGSCESLNFMGARGNVLHESLFFPRQITCYDIHQAAFSSWKGDGPLVAVKAFQLRWEPMTTELKLQGLNTQIDYLSGLGDWPGCIAVIDKIKALTTDPKALIEVQSLYTSIYVWMGNYLAALKSYKTQMRMDSTRESTDEAILAAFFLLNDQIDSAKTAVSVDGLPNYALMSNVAERVDGLQRTFDIDIPLRHPFKAWVEAEKPAAWQRQQEARTRRP